MKLKYILFTLFIMVTGVINAQKTNDFPLPPTNAKAVLSEDGKHVTVTWDPVTSSVGENGGYVDVSLIKYAIFDAYGKITDPALALTTECSHTFDYSGKKDQDFVAYEITAWIDDAYVSAPYQCYTNVVVIGDPYNLPWNESFPDGGYNQMWGVSMGSTSSSVIAGTLYDDDIETLASHDGDNGFFVIIPKVKGAKYGLFGGKINVSKASKPVLEFFYQGKANVIDAQIARDGGDFETAKSIDLKANPADDWTLCQIPLDAYKSSKYIQVQLFVTAGDNISLDDPFAFSVSMDNIRVRDLAKSDIALTRVTAPAETEADNRMNINVRIDNISEKTANAIVTLYRGSKAIATELVEEISANSYKTVAMTDSISLADDDQIKYRIVVTSSSDDNPNNNNASFTVNVKFPDYPMVENLAASVSGATASLTWDAIDIAEATLAIVRTEDFENSDYTPFTISDFGGWTMYDGDKEMTYSITKIPNDPYTNKAKAWQLFNFDKSGLSADSRIDFQGPDESSCTLIAYSPEGKADDWLISPKLSGKEQTVSFYAKGFSTAYGNEFFEVLYSTSGKSISDFQKIDAIEGYNAEKGLGEDWVECKTKLPQGAKYFAIRYVTDNNWAMFLDNITFEASGAMPANTELIGYNILRNGNVINAKPVTSNRYDDELTQTGNYEYRVNAVYSIGESRYSKPQKIDFEMTDAIGNVNNSLKDQPAYSVEGRRIPDLNTFRGVYIKGGKKVVK